MARWIVEYFMLCGVTYAEFGKRIKRKDIVTMVRSVKWKMGEAMCLEWTSADGRKLHQCGDVGMGRRGNGRSQTLQTDTFKRLARGQ